MGRTRDRYDDGLTEKQRAAEAFERDKRMRAVQAYWCDRAACYFLTAAISSPNASRPGTWANTLLQSFTSSDPSFDYGPGLPLYASYRQMRKAAWRALAGTRPVWTV